MLDKKQINLDWCVIALTISFQKPLRGIRRVQGATRRRPARPAISIPQLNIIINHLRLYTSDRRDGLMLQSAVSLAFYGLLHSAEYTSPSASSYSANSTLLFSDVSINRVSKVATIFIKSSKTDPFRIGCAVRVGSTGLLSCPVMALYNFISVHPSMAGPLFTFQDGTYLTRAYVSRLIGDSLPQLPHANTHSFRIGGATAAASAGIANSTIQILGRWSSDAYRQYLRLPDSVIVTCQLEFLLLLLLLVCGTQICFPLFQLLNVIYFYLIFI